MKKYLENSRTPEKIREKELKFLWKMPLIMMRKVMSFIWKIY